MVAGLDVYKNPSAEHIEGGIGGLVDVRTRRPLDLKGFTASAAISGKYNDMVKSLQPEYFGLIANRWNVGDGEMGLLLAGNFQKSWNRSDNAPGPGGANLRQNRRRQQRRLQLRQSWAGPTMRPSVAARTSLPDIRQQ
jgi:iron complex outermembrane receptor protein